MQLLLEKCMLPQFGDDLAAYNCSYGVRQRHAAPANRARSPRQKLHELGENHLPTSQRCDGTARASVSAADLRLLVALVLCVIQPVVACDLQTATSAAAFARQRALFSPP